MTAVSANTRRTAGAGRVLVVEDDEGIRDMLRYNLASAGFDCNLWWIDLRGLPGWTAEEAAHFLQTGERFNGKRAQPKDALKSDLQKHP